MTLAATLGAIRTAAAQVPAPGGVRVKRLRGEIYFNVGEAAFLLAPPILMYRADGDMATEAKAFCDVLGDSLGYVPLTSPIPLPGAPELRVMAVAAEAAPTFIAQAEVYRLEQAGEVPEEPTGNGLGEGPAL